MSIWSKGDGWRSGKLGRTYRTRFELAMREKHQMSGWNNSIQSFDGFFSVHSSFCICLERCVPLFAISCVKTV